MKINFIQGTVVAPLTSGVPDFLVYNPGNDTITINVGTTLVRVTAAYGDANYLHEERVNSTSAWGPFNRNLAWGSDPGAFTAYLYWDFNLSTGQVTSGFTPFPQVTSYTAPVSPGVSQHWFNKYTNQMSYWDGAAWRPCIRVFVGYWNDGLQVITEYPLGSQVGVTFSGDQSTWPDHGFILFGLDQKGIRYSDSTFVTTTSAVQTFHGSFSSPIRLELANSTALAAEAIPAFTAISNVGDGTVQLAYSSEAGKGAIGISMVDVAQGGVVDIVSRGIVYNDQWSWDYTLGQYLFLQDFGLLTQTRPSNGNVQQVGSIIDPHTVLIDVTSPISITSGGGADATLTNSVTVIGTSVGAIDSGYVFAEGTTFTQFVELISQKAIPPSYTTPSVTLGSSPSPGTVEIGTVENITLNDSYNAGNGGVVIYSHLTKNSSLISTAFPYTDTGVVMTDAPIVYQAQVSYAGGPTLNNNMGSPDPTGKILAGIATSNNLSFVGSRAAFYGTPSAAPTTSAEVRVLGTSSFNTGNNSGVDSNGSPLTGSPVPNFTITIPSGSTHVVFAYPATSRPVASVLYEELSYSQVKANFVLTTVTVEGANGYAGIVYNVYTYTPVEPFAVTNHYQVFI